MDHWPSACLRTLRRVVCSSARARGSQAIDPALTSKIYRQVDESVAEPAACWGKARPLQPPAQPYARECHKPRAGSGTGTAWAERLVLLTPPTHPRHRGVGPGRADEVR